MKRSASSNGAIDYGVGVSNRETYVLKQADEEYTAVLMICDSHRFMEAHRLVILIQEICGTL